MEAETALGDRPRRVDEHRGHGFVTGYDSFVVDARDPLGDGFLLS